VAVLTETDVRELAAFKGEEAPVTSLYLDVDGARHVRRQDLLHELDLLLRIVRRDHAGNPSVCRDLKRIEDHVRGGIDRSHVRGLALFSCAAHDFWRVVELPVAVRSQVVVNHTPAIRQLEAVVDEYERFGVLLADKQRARMFVYELGELADSSELFDQLPRQEDDGRAIRKDGVRDHVAALAHAHLRNAADVAFKVFQDGRFDRLVIGAPDEIANELESLLHPYLRERLVARCKVRVDASVEEIRQVALEVEADVEREGEADAVRRLRDAVGSDNRGVIGLDATLRALVERRVDVLLVSTGFAAPGWRCGGCGWIGRVGRKCPVCSADMHEVADVVEEAIEDALAQSCEVEVCVGNADLDVMGQIGALLRY
jgi:peptide chain release factor subunit 1